MLLRLRNIKSWLSFKRKKKPNPSQMYEVYTDKQGNKWYALKNPAHIDAERALSAWAYMEDSKYSLSRENRKAILDGINGGINRNDLSTIAKLVGVMEAAEELYCHDEILLNLASVYCFLNDEIKPKTGIDGREYYPLVDYVQEQKRKIWSEDKDAKSFFLQFAYQYTARYSEQPRLNVPEYLEKVKPVIENINFQIQKLKSPKKD